MNIFSKISPQMITNSPFTLFSDEWTLITAGTIDKYNTMTASWGGVGFFWNKNVATIYIRPQRYTYEFVEKNDFFTLSFFGGDCKDILTYCGRNSGRDVDKAAHCNLTATDFDGGVAFEEASLVLVCKKLYHSDIDPQNFHDATLESHYNGDYHRMYIGEIISAYSLDK